MSKWTEYKLKDLVEIVNGFAFKSPNFLAKKENGALPVVKIKNVANGDVHLDNCQYHLYDDSLKRYIVNKDDILIALTGNHPEVMTQVVGEVSRYKLNELALLNQRVAKINAKSGLNPDFLYYFLKDDATHDYLASQSAGSANQANISKTDIEDIVIQLPDIDEQVAIAETLTSLDKKIDLLQYQNQTLEHLAETLFRQWFIEEVNEAWPDTNLSKHCEVFRGLSYKGSGLDQIGIGLPMHNLNSVYEFGGYKYEGIKYYSGEYRERHLLNAGDIIVTNTEQGHEHRLIGFPGIVPKHFGERGLFSQHIYRVVLLKETYLTKEFLYYLLMTPSVREQIIAATNGSTVNMLAIEGLQLPEFKLPPSSKVDLYTDIVNGYWKKKEMNEAQVLSLTKLRDSLLPKLISGEFIASK